MTKLECLKTELSKMWSIFLSLQNWHKYFKMLLILYFWILEILRQGFFALKVITGKILNCVYKIMPCRTKTIKKDTQCWP